MHTTTITETPPVPPRCHSVLRRRSLLGAMAGLVLLSAACSSSAEADPVSYFEGFATLQSELMDEVDALFESPAARDVDALVGDAAPAALDAEQDAAVRRFVGEFWEGTAAAVARHRVAMADLDVPDSNRVEHEAYLDALDAVVESSEGSVERADETSGAEQLATFWDPAPEIEAVDGACSALVEAAATHGVTITRALCLDE